MCEPISIAAASMAIAAAAGGLSAYSSISAGQAQAEQARRNADVAAWKAGAALEQGQTEGEMKNLEAGARISKGAVERAGGNVDTQSGSAVDTAESNRLLAEYDVNAIRVNAARQSWGYETQAQDFLAEANLAESRAGFGAASSILGAASQVGSIGYSSGMFPKIKIG